jgi:hypothetical protein
VKRSLPNRVVRGTALLGLVLAVVLAGCGDTTKHTTKARSSPTTTARSSPTTTAVKGVFAGKVQGTDAYIAIVSDGTQAVGYACDGSTVSVWLMQPRLAGARAELLNREGTPIGSVTLAAGTASGAVQVAGASHPFTASLATGKVGLYRNTTGTPDQPSYTESGWILLADGSVRGNTNFVDPNNLSRPATRAAGPLAGKQATPTPGFIAAFSL